MGYSHYEFMHDLYIAEIYRPAAIFFCRWQCGSIFIYFYTVNSGKRYALRSFKIIQGHQN